MHIVLAPVGTRGDVEPLLQLNDALRARGHVCSLAAPRNFAALAEREGLRFTSLGAGFDELARGTHNEMVVVRAFLRTLRDQYDGLMRATEGADVIVGAMMCFAGPSVARVRGVPWVYAGFSPHYLRSRLMVPGGLPFRSMPPWMLGIFNAFQDRFVSLGLRPWIAEERRLGFAAPDGVWPHLALNGELLLAYDEELLTTPADATGRLNQVGVLRRDNTSAPLSPELAAFLDAGARPVYLGFGSMSHRDPRELMTLLLGSVARTGVRAVINAGWSGLVATDPPPSVLVVPHVPHDALFPRCAGVVHHGGAGTLHAAALAGVPQAIVHHWADQIHHGWRVESLGIGPGPTTIGRLDGRWLDATLTAFTSPGAMHERAKALAARMRPRLDGGERAAEIVERAVARQLA